MEKRPTEAAEKELNQAKYYKVLFHYHQSQKFGTLQRTERCDFNTALKKKAQ